MSISRKDFFKHLTGAIAAAALLPKSFETEAQSDEPLPMAVDGGVSVRMPVTLSADDGTMWIANAEGNMFVTRNGGANWEPVAAYTTWEIVA